VKWQFHPCRELEKRRGGRVVGSMPMSRDDARGGSSRGERSRSSPQAAGPPSKSPRSSTTRSWSSP